MPKPNTESLEDYESVRRYLFGLKSQGPKYGIDRMRVLSERLGNPERNFPVIHIAGTNGKGSVAAMLENILRKAGCKTGLYTSPHLMRQGERVQVNRKILHEDEIVNYVRELRPVAEDIAALDPDDHPSFFEFMTAMAFLHFKRERVDVAVIETGLGGRLDATNVVRPDLTIITEIGFDHMEMLGNSLGEIAVEKAGILKKGCSVVLARQPDEADVVIRRIATERECPLKSVRDEFGDDPADYPTTNLEGSHQRRNAATATLAARSLRSAFSLPNNLIARALLDVRWPGRWDRMQVAERTFIFEAAHNPDGATCLEENLSKLELKNGCQPHLVIGILGTDRALTVVPAAARHASSLHFVEVPDQARSCTPEELVQFVPDGFAGIVNKTDIVSIFPQARTCSVGKAGDTIVVTGSIYLIGQVMDRLLNDQPVNQGNLQD